MKHLPVTIVPIVPLLFPLVSEVRITFYANNFVLSELFPIFAAETNIQGIIMGSIFIIQGILIYIYAFDHNPPHIHVRSGTDNFSITIRERIIEGKARSRTVAIVNEFIDSHEAELMELWERAQRGEKITKIR